MLSAAAVTVAVVAVSSSAPLIAYAAAPALAVAFWRNALAATVLTPISLGPRRHELRDVVSGSRRRDGFFCVLAGLALAAHFATWMPSVQLTTVATATALVATQPVWQGLIAVVTGRRLPLSGWIGIGLAVCGAAWATGIDIGVSARAVTGDVLAVAGGFFAAVYTALGERARTRLSTITYTWVCYGVCAAVLLVVCLVGGVQLGGYDNRTWAAILALVVGAQLLGHSMFNYALNSISATTISVLILLEVPGAALLAWLWLGQVPRLAALPGLLLLLAGVAVVVLGSARSGRRGTEAPLPDGATPIDEPSTDEPATGEATVDEGADAVPLAGVVRPADPEAPPPR
jgi:drug/metabolite transporter (DMT)-like permease